MIREIKIGCQGKDKDQTENVKEMRGKTMVKRKGEDDRDHTLDYIYVSRVTHKYSLR